MSKETVVHYLKEIVPHSQRNNQLVLGFLCVKFPSMQKTTSYYCLTNRLFKIISIDLQCINKIGKFTCFSFI